MLTLLIGKEEPSLFSRLWTVPFFGSFGEKRVVDLCLKTALMTSFGVCGRGSDVKGCVCVAALITHIEDRDFGLVFLIVGFKWRVAWITGRTQAHLS